MQRTSWDSSTRPRGGWGPVSSHRASPAPQSVSRTGSPPCACVPNCEHRRQSFHITSRSRRPTRSPWGEAPRGYPRHSQVTQEPEEDSCLSPAGRGHTGRRGVASRRAPGQSSAGHSPRTVEPRVCLFPQRPEGRFGCGRRCSPQPSTGPGRGGGAGVCLPPLPTVRAEG